MTRGELEALSSIIKSEVDPETRKLAEGAVRDICHGIREERDRAQREYTWQEVAKVAGFVLLVLSAAMGIGQMATQSLSDNSTKLLLGFGTAGVTLLGLSRSKGKPDKDA